MQVTEEDRQVKLARATARHLANEGTPLIRNCWYVAAFSHDVEPGKLFARRLLDVNVVMYRDNDGRVHALRDRCAHRSFPLSKGSLDNGTIVCGYHGFRYDGDGHCIQVPSQGDRCPAGVSVRSYPVVEMRPHVWIWMGDPSLADEASIPSAPWMRESDQWAAGHGYMHANANYVHLHENLLDLSHLTYLHPQTFGTPDYAKAPYSIEMAEPLFIVRRTVAPTLLPPIYANPTGMVGVDAARIVESTFISPAISYTEVVLQNLSLPESERRNYHLKTAQIITPEGQGSLHYQFTVVRDFALADQSITDFVLAGIRAVFTEDVDALEIISHLKEEEGDADFHETSVPSDRAGVGMRKYLKTLADQEAGLSIGKASSS